MFELVISTIIWLFLSLFLFYFPGKLLINLIRKPVTSLEKLVLSYTAGIALFTLLALLTYLNSLRPLFIVLLLIANLITFKLPKLPVFKPNWWLLILIALGTLAQVSLIFPSNLPQPDGSLKFINTPFIDSLWHIAVAQQMQLNFPPLHPLYSGYTVTNYHYFLSLLIAGVNYVIPFLSVPHLYFQFLPTLISLLYGLASYCLGKRLGATRTAGLLAVFFAYFASSFAYLVPLLPGTAPTVWHESSFWLIQPPSMLVNPHTGISYLLFISGLLALALSSFPLTALIWSVMLGFKIYAGLLVVAAAGLTCLRRPKLFRLLFFLLLLSLPVFLLTTSTGQSLLVFSPGYFLRKLVEDPDRVPLPTWILKEEHYLAANNTLRLIQLRLQELFLFTVGNFGLRLVLIIPFLPYFIRQLKTNVIWQIMGLVSLIGFTIPHLFTQAISPINTLQFAYYALICANFAAAIAASRSPKLLLIPILILASITTWREAYLELNQWRTIDAPTVQALNTLRALPPGVVLTAPEDVLTPAFAAKQTYFSSPYSLHVVGTNASQRHTQANWFLDPATPELDKTQFLKKHSIRYLFFPPRITQLF